MPRSKNSARTAPGRPFVPGDPRINRSGRPPLSEQQREFRRKLFKMDADVRKAVKQMVKDREPSVVNKLVDKLAGQDAVDRQVEAELDAFLSKLKARLPPETYEVVVAAALADAP